MKNCSVFSGNSNKDLAEKVAEYMEIPLGKSNISTFSDGESRVEILENVRLNDVFLIQSICKPVNNNLMELLLMIDAVKRSSAKRITAVIPYYGYSRQDRKVLPRVPISAKLVADIITKAGANRIITLDLHAGQIQGFFNIPVDNLFAAPILIKYIKEEFKDKDLVMVSPDAGGVERARAYAKRLSASLAIVDKRRLSPNKAEAMNVIGDVKGKYAIILDDMVDTAGTLTEASTALLKNGASKVFACCTHAVLSGPAIERIEKSNIESLIVTDSIPLEEKKKKCKKITSLSVYELIGEAIRRCHEGNSVNSLFEI